MASSPAVSAAPLPKLVAIQVLRGVAALAIALIHLEPEWRSLGGWPAEWVRPFPFEAGVDVFFVISGFVMVFASRDLFGQAGAARLFLARRVARVVPLYWLTTLLVLLLLGVRPEMMRSAVASPDLVVASFLFIPWTRPDGLVQPVYTLGWTLNFEMYFYLMFAAVLLLGLTRRATVGVAAAVLCGLVASGIAFFPLPEPLGFWTSPLQIAFVIGMALGLLRAEGFVLPLAARIVIALIGIGFFAWIGGDYAVRTGQNAAFVFALPSACLVAACGLSPGRPAGRPRHRTIQRIGVRIGESLGDASYAIYLLHPFAIRGVLRGVDTLGLGPKLGTVGITILALIGTLALALATYRWVERPITRWSRTMLEPRRLPAESS